MKTAYVIPPIGGRTAKASDIAAEDMAQWRADNVNHEEDCAKCTTQKGRKLSHFRIAKARIV